MLTEGPFPRLQEVAVHVDESQKTEQFVRLFALHQRRVYSYILTLVPHRPDAEDVLQETSTVLWKKFDDYQPGSNFLAWACQIAYFEALSHRRRQQRHRLELRESFLELVAQETLARSDELEERYLALANCLEKLSDRGRDLIARRYTGGATVETIAAQVGRPVEGLYKAYQRLRRALAECIDRTVSRANR